jgi:hypothetical protein
MSALFSFSTQTPEMDFDDFSSFLPITGIQAIHEFQDPSRLLAMKPIGRICTAGTVCLLVLSIKSLYEDKA